MMQSVRTTITLDAETQALVEKAMKERKLSFKQVVNEAIVRGLTTTEAPQPFRTKTHNMGEARINLDKATQIAAELENEEILRKMTLGK
jgi:hypothetical protein